MSKIYRVIHDWADDEQPTVYLMASNGKPTLEQAIEVCQIDFEPERNEQVSIEEVFVEGGPLVALPKVDWAQLRAQKLELLEAAEARQELHGIVHLLDEIQDQASALLGEETVFGVGERPEE